MENKNEENAFSPKGFFMKLEWYELFTTMKPKQFQNVILNSYNYLLGNELLGMNQFESTIFEYAIKPVLVHNNKVYQEKCAHNARISKKGVEANDGHHNHHGHHGSGHRRYYHNKHYYHHHGH